MMSCKEIGNLNFGFGKADDGGDFEWMDGWMDGWMDDDDDDDDDDGWRRWV